MSRVGKKKHIIASILTIMLFCNILIAMCNDTLIYASDNISRPVIKLVKNDAGNSIQVSIGKTSNADGYYVYMKKSGDRKFKKVKKLKKDGSKERSVVINNFPEGTYYFKVRAYHKEGSILRKSQYSKTRKIILNNTSDFEAKFEELVDIFMWRMAGNIKAQDLEFMLLDSYMYFNHKGKPDFLFNIESGDAIAPSVVIDQWFRMNDDGTASYIRCKLSDMLSFIENVIGEKIEVEEESIYNGTFICKDGYLTEWGSSWYISYEGLDWDISDFKYKYDGDTITASFILTEYCCGELEGNTKYTTYWKKNKKSCIGYTLQKSEREDF